MNPVWLASRLAAIVRDPRWGGGIHRDHARELLRCDHRELSAAVAIAYRRGDIDACWGWIVAPPASREAKQAA